MDTNRLPFLTDALLCTLGRHSRQAYLLKVLHDCGLDASGLLRAQRLPYPVSWPALGLSLMLQPIPAAFEPERAPDQASVAASGSGAGEDDVLVNATLEAAKAAWAKHLEPHPVADGENDADGAAPDQPPDDAPAPVAAGAALPGYSWGLQSITLDAVRWPGTWLASGELNPETVTPDELIHLLAQDKAEAFCAPGMAACFTSPGMNGQTWAIVALFDPASGKLESLTFSRHGDWVALSILPPGPNIHSSSLSA